MAIKSSQTLVQEALNEIETISPDEALKLSKNNKCNFIDLRDIRELQNNGMIKNYGIDASEFLNFVHDIDLSFLKNDKALEVELSKIRDKKIIFTNGPKTHAENVTKKIGIDKLFDGIFDIVESDFVPKPDIKAYKKLIDKYKIEPQYCILIEDIARNLKPAYELGMKTVWIKNDEPWAAEFSNESFINYRTENLTRFLKEINELRKN